jgi:putative DNA primase/helicase
VGVIRPDNLPDDLLELDGRWGQWRLEHGRKVPYQVNGSRASTTNPSHWSAFELAFRAYSRRPNYYSGLAFVFFESDGLVGIDVDTCLDASGAPKTWAHNILSRFSDTYAEISPSGKGVKIWCRGRLPGPVGKVCVEDGGIEIYDRGRYFAVTGRAFRGAPLQVEDHTEDVLQMYQRLARRHSDGWQYNPNPDGRIPKGTQHLTLVSIAGTLRKRGICDEAIRACLHAVNTRQCEQPGPPEHIDRIVMSSARWGNR